MSQTGYLLKVTDFKKDPQHWRWELTDNHGRFLDDHEVNLDPAHAYYSAFTNLDRYLWVHSDPMRRISDQIKVMKEVGDWVGENVFGNVGKILSKLKVPMIVRVQVPSDDRWLLYLPLEMARIEGKPLALSNARLVFELADREPLIDKDPISKRLRILAIFSLPTDASVLALRRERRELTNIFNRIAQNKNLAIDFRILQYGVTRETLAKALQDGEGWDLIHFSGHGERAELLLEKSDGTGDLINRSDLADILASATGRLKLVTLSACLSAAATLEETMVWLKLWKHDVAKSNSASVSSEPSKNDSVPALAWELERDLDCAVLAMRYPVGDEFAINLASKFYDLLLDKNQPMARALQTAMQETLKSDKGDYNASIPPISLATPTICGGRAADLIIEPPPAAGDMSKTPYASLAYFPDEPEHFVGRSGPLAQASSVLASESNKRGVLFHGMAGAGKTACANEIAHHYHRNQIRFQGGFVWYSAPEAGRDILTSLKDFAGTMERTLDDLKMAYIVDRSEEFEAWLPRLSEYLGRKSVLIVLDNIENLLTSDDDWRDKRWGSLVNALLKHSGQSRLIVTSRRVPKGIDENLICRIPIHALSLNESILLAREMPNLGRLLEGKDKIGSEKGRELVVRTLELVQGHPKLIEFAESKAADSVALDMYLKSAHRSWGGDEGGLKEFFKEGVSSKGAEEFMSVLRGWTQDVSSSLPESARTLFQMLCAVENDDMLQSIVKQVWPQIWKKLGKDGSAPEIEPLIVKLKASSLLEAKDIPGDVRYCVYPDKANIELDEGPRMLFGVISSIDDNKRLYSILNPFWPRIWERQGLAGQAPDMNSIIDKLRSEGLIEAQVIGSDVKYSIHPGVAEAGLAEAGSEGIDKDLRTDVDSTMAEYWQDAFYRSIHNQEKGLSSRVVEAGLKAAPYLIRLQRFSEASRLLEDVIYRDSSPRTVDFVLPKLLRIAESTKGTENERKDSGIYAHALFSAHRWKEAEPLLRSLLDQCEDIGDFVAADVLAGDLFSIFKEDGRYTDALEIVDEMKNYTLQAHLGPWTQLSIEGRRLQILNKLGRNKDVLDMLEPLRRQMKTLPSISDKPEEATSWKVMATILGAGGNAALNFGNPDLALDLNNEVLDIKTRLNLPKLEIAKTQLNNCAILLKLGRYTEASELLLRCKAVFEEENYIQGLSSVFSGLADMEKGLNHYKEAIEFETKGLYYSYIVYDPEPIMRSHNKIAHYLIRDNLESAFEHRLAAALISYQTGSDMLPFIIKDLCNDLEVLDINAMPSFNQICSELENTEGIRFRELFMRLPKRAEDGDGALRAILEIKEAIHPALKNLRS